MATVICHTPDCENADLAVELAHPLDDEGNPDPNWQIYCGACSQPITDVENDTDDS